MKEKPSLDKSAQYKSFIEQRDLALEKISQRYSASLSIIMDHLIELTMDIVASMHSKKINAIYKPNQEFQKIDALFSIAIQSSIDLVTRMRRSVYLLSYAGEAEAIGQALGKKQKANLNKHDLDEAEKNDTLIGGTIEARVAYFYNKLKRKVENAIEYGVVLEEPLHDLLDRVRSAFPEHKTYQRPKKNLRPLKEADTPDWLRKAQKEYFEDLSQSQQPEDITMTEEPKTDMTVGIIPEDDWEKMVSDYKDEYLPENSFARSAVDYTEEDGVRKYDWELEQEVTNDFVKQVREGQNDAANDNGITDMMWIAVSHKTLCEYCQWRDGLTSTEIEDKLKTEHADDPYDAIVPPLHLNCYCKVAPVTKELLNATPDDSKLKEFDEWLNS